VFIDQVKYLEMVQVFRAQPAHRRPIFSDASRKLRVHRRTVTEGWEHGWPATKDPRRPTPLPPLKDVCAPGTKPPEGFDPEPAPRSTAAPSSVGAAALLEIAAAPGPSSGPSAEAPGVESGPSSTPPRARSTTVAPAATADPVAEIAARQASLEAQESRNLVGSLNLAGHIASTGDTVLKMLYEAITSPAAQERLRSFIIEKPERIMSLLADLAKAVESSTKASERIFSMTRLAAGQATSIQEHRVDSRPQNETPSQTAARVRAVFAELAAANLHLDEDGRPRTLAPIDVTPIQEE
jgi:hypothetical protein